MCYMHTVGVRELRQQLTRYLRRVAAGETLRVTERGRAVAVLAPLPEAAGAAARLVAAGRARPPRLDLARLGLPEEVAVEIPVSLALAEQRAES